MMLIVPPLPPMFHSSGVSDVLAVSYSGLRSATVVLCFFSVRVRRAPLAVVTVSVGSPTVDVRLRATPTVRPLLRDNLVGAIVCALLPPPPRPVLGYLPVASIIQRPSLVV
ncbi:hypothetical protein Taro_044630 [Colocasia esculenta]|uniref:Uncharacterized protein n=1 Tax=Colocasia esculenta TaxID=4460 RepID=A0A843WME6_COLES|nr:hypothetical protein [Colocasia esculenta]